MRNTLLATAAAFGLAFAPVASQHAFAQSAPTPDSSAPTPDAAPAPDSAGTAAAPGSDAGTAAPMATKKHHHHHASSNSEGSGDEKFAHEPGTGESGPASMKASNIDSADSHSDIAPHLPMPKAGHDATADAYLGAAQRALRAHHTGEAQQALEMAETRLLDRSTPAGSAGTPASDPQITQINEARQALGHGDMKAAHQAIQMALGSTSAGGGAGTGMGSTSGAASSGAMNSTTDTTTTSTGSSMSNGSMGSSGSMGSNGSMGATSTNSAPTGAPMMAPSGAGPTPGASAGSSAGGGALGSGTNDSAGGAK